MNALVGVANLVVALWVAEQPRAVLVCWDTVGTPTYRNELWPAYQTAESATRSSSSCSACPI